MAFYKKWLPALAVAILLWGCAHTNITNLTPSQHARTTNGIYPIELIWDSNMQAMRPDSIKPYVMVGFDTYEMRKTLGMNNRFEARIPVPADKDSVSYQFKVDYQFNRMGQPPGSGSRLSRNYTLRIVDQ